MKNDEIFNLNRSLDGFEDLFYGHFEYEGFDDQLTDDSSFRFCMQIHKNETDNYPADQAHAVGTADSKRSRLRFFNKKYTDFMFHPQLALENGLDGDGKNPDFNQQDDITNWCTLPWDPKDQSGNSYYVTPNADNQDRLDPYGIAVLETMIDKTEKRAHITFIRPMKALSDYDIDLEKDTYYRVYFNFGIFDNENDTDKAKLKGLVSNSDMPFTMHVKAAEKAKCLMISMITLATSYFVF